MISGEFRVIDDEDAIRNLTIEDAIAGVEEGFRLAGMGLAYSGGRTLVRVDNGTFHIVSGGLRYADPPLVVTKVNGRFDRTHLGGVESTVRGVMLVSSGEDGRPLALIGSARLTVLRTAAVAAVASKYLAPRDASVLLVIGTGRVARAATVAIHHVQAIQRVIVSGRDPRKRQRLARSLREAGLRVKTVAHVADGLAEADIVVTATASTSPWFQAVDVRPGTTILALGSDAPGKQELPPEILAHAGVVTDSTAQCLLVGELGHAVRANLLAVEKVRAELGAIVAGQARGRMSNEENIVFDSTGTAIADAAMARAVLRN